ncbi:hypothetical protein PSYMP_28218, partial [Pseudomonas amygdali pv. morsprunorum str. M302280]
RLFAVIAILLDHIAAATLLGHLALVHSLGLQRTHRFDRVQRLGDQ